jgi:plasmid maintenance system antidote protein VapI
METLSLIILIGCLILIGVAITTGLLKNQIHHPVEDHQESATTRARLEFEAAEKDLTVAKTLIRIINNASNPTPETCTRAQDNFEMATEEWLFKLKKVLQLKKRARSPSPETLQLYARFTARPEIVTE